MPYGEKEKADDVPARLSKNEFVFTADAVRAAGGGSRYATRAFATPIFVASATPIFVASATPYFRISATRTAATPKILF